MNVAYDSGEWLLTLIGFWGEMKLLHPLLSTCQA